MGLVLIIVLILLLIGGLPTWKYSRDWGYRPVGVLSVVLIMLIVWCCWGTYHAGFNVATGVAPTHG